MQIVMAEGKKRDLSNLSSSIRSVGMASRSSLSEGNGVDHENTRYPHCIVWTPIPMLT